MSSEAATVLVVDDEPEIRELMRDFLEAEGFGVETADSADDALTAVSGADCILLDVMMPGRSGFDLCRQLRRTTDVPVIFLTARDGDEDKIRGLGLGADDYVAKSATAGEVVARIKAVLRRARRPDAEAGVASLLHFGPLTLDLGAHQARLSGRALALT